MKGGRRSRGLANIQQIAVTKIDEIQGRSKRQRVIAQPLTPAATAIEYNSSNPRIDQIFDLFQHFCAIEKVLNTLHQKKRHPDWETVREAATRFSGSEIKLTDIDMILEIHPAAYLLSWRIFDAQRNIFDLCIKLPHEFLGKLESRSETFRYHSPILYDLSTRIRRSHTNGVDYSAILEKSLMNGASFIPVKI